MVSLEMEHAKIQARIIAVDGRKKLIIEIVNVTQIQILKTKPLKTNDRNPEPLFPSFDECFNVVYFPHFESYLGRQTKY